MKKEVTPEFMWHLYSTILTFQIAIVTTVDTKGRVNAAPYGLILPFCSNSEKPQMLLGGNNKWHTSLNIEATGEFVLNYAGKVRTQRTADIPAAVTGDGLTSGLYFALVLKYG